MVADIPDGSLAIAITRRNAFRSHAIIDEWMKDFLPEGRVQDRWKTLYLRVASRTGQTAKGVSIFGETNTLKVGCGTSPDGVLASLDIVGELQALHTAGEQATGDVASASDRQTSEDRIESIAELTNGKGGKGSSGSSGSIYESGKGGKSSSGKNKGGKGSSGSIYEIDEHTKAQCTKAKYKIEGDFWTRF